MTDYSVKGAVLFWLDHPEDFNYIKDFSNPLDKANPWFDPYYALINIFSEEELRAMSEETVNNCFRVAEKLGGIFY